MVTKNNDCVDEGLANDAVKYLLYADSSPALHLSTSPTVAAIVVWSEGQMR